LSFPEEGLYLFELRADGVAVAHCRLHVHQIEG
jgi:hypothetical protein